MNMKTKFTKGKWVVNVVRDQFEIIGHETNPYIADVLCLDKGGAKAIVEAKANAHLIASAPAMYKLLEKFLPMDGDGNGWDFVYDEGSEHMGEEVISMLSKARGE